MIKFTYIKRSDLYTDFSENGRPIPYHRRKAIEVLMRRSGFNPETDNIENIDVEKIPIIEVRGKIIDDHVYVPFPFAKIEVVKPATITNGDQKYYKLHMDNVTILSMARFRFIIETSDKLW